MRGAGAETSTPRMRRPRSVAESQISSPISPAAPAPAQTRIAAGARGRTAPSASGWMASADRPMTVTPKPKASATKVETLATSKALSPKAE